MSLLAFLIVLMVRIREVQFYHPFQGFPSTQVTAVDKCNVGQTCRNETAYGRSTLLEKLCRVLCLCLDGATATTVTSTKDVGSTEAPATAPFRHVHIRLHCHTCAGVVKLVHAVYQQPGRRAWFRGFVVSYPHRTALLHSRGCVRDAQ